MRAVSNRLSVHDVAPLLSVHGVRLMSVPGVIAKLSVRDVTAGCPCGMSVQRCRNMLPGLVSLWLSKYPNPAGDSVPCGLRSPPDDVIIPLFPKFLKARENAVKITQTKFRMFSPDIS